MAKKLLNQGPKDELDESIQSAIDVVTRMSVAATKKITSLAEETCKTIEATVNHMNSMQMNGSGDHDLLIELKTQMDGIKSDIKEIKDGTTQRITNLEKDKADYSDLESLAKEIHGKREERMRKLESATSRNWIYLILYTLLTGGLTALVITHIVSS